jgi:MHS family alpha-ketoglutarate permease-like MFS transporter
MTMEKATAIDHGRERHVTDRTTVAAGAAGHFIEWYDWTIYGLMSATFAPLMFPTADPVVALLAAYGTFAAGFLMRPVGSFVLSPFADRYGRKSVLALTIVLAGIGSLIIALTPTYDQVGVLAPVLLLGARLLQGFATGGEYQTAAAFLNEHAPREKRAFAASSQMVSTGFGDPVCDGGGGIDDQSIRPRNPQFLGLAGSLPARRGAVGLRCLAAPGYSGKPHF